MPGGFSNKPYKMKDIFIPVFEDRLIRPSYSFSEMQVYTFLSHFILQVPSCRFTRSGPFIQQSFSAVIPTDRTCYSQPWSVHPAGVPSHPGVRNSRRSSPARPVDCSFRIGGEHLQCIAELFKEALLLLLLTYVGIKAAVRYVIHAGIDIRHDQLRAMVFCMPVRHSAQDRFPLL